MITIEIHPEKSERESYEIPLYSRVFAIQDFIDYVNKVEWWEVHYLEISREYKYYFTVEGLYYNPKTKKYKKILGYPF